MMNWIFFVGNPLGAAEVPRERARLRDSVVAFDERKDGGGLDRPG